LFDTFEEEIEGCTDIENMEWYIMKFMNKRFLFIRYKNIKGTNIRKEVPTRVSLHNYIVIVRNFGGEAWEK
jgi:hypothetical protein